MNSDHLIQELEDQIRTLAKQNDDLSQELSKYTSVSPTLDLSTEVWGSEYLTLMKPNNVYSITIPREKATLAYIRSACKSYVYNYITSNTTMTFAFWIFAQDDEDFRLVYGSAFSINGIPSEVYRQLESIWQSDLEIFVNFQLVVVQAAVNAKTALMYRPLSVLRANASATAPINWTGTKNRSQAVTPPHAFGYSNESVYRYLNPSATFLRTTDSKNGRHIYQYEVDVFTYAITTTTENFVGEDDWWW